MKSKLILKSCAANLVTHLGTRHLRVTCYGRIRAKQLERCAIKIKTLPVLEKVTGGVFKNLVVVRAEQGVKARGWDPNGFWRVGVRWGVGWLKSTRGGVLLGPNKDG